MGGVVLALVLLGVLRTSNQALAAPKCESTFDLSVYGRPCSRGSACFDGRQPISGICAYRGLCALSFTSDTTGDRWECRDCIVANSADGHCREAFPSVGLGAGEQQARAVRQTNIVGHYVTFPHAARPPRATAIIDATDNGTLPMSNFSDTRAPSLTLWIGDPAVVSVGTSLPALGLPVFHGRSLMPSFFMSPRPIVANATDGFSQRYFGTDDGLSATVYIDVVERTGLATDRRRRYNVSAAAVSARPIAYRDWPYREGPIVEPRSQTSFRPQAASGSLPVFDDAFARDSAWTSQFSPQFRRMGPGFFQLGVSGSALLPVAVVNRFHNVFVAGSASSGLLAPTSAAIATQGRDDVSIVAAPSSAYLDLFSAASTDDSTTRPTHRALDDDQAVVDVDIVARVATVWYLASGDVRLQPVTNATGSLVNPAAFANLKSFFTNKHRITNFGDTSVVYLPGSKEMRPFGLNAFGQFAASGQVGVTFDGSTAIPLPFESTSETVEWIALGGKHIAVTSSTGSVYFAGETRWTGAACFSIGDASGDRSVLTKMAVGNVSKAVAGAQFTVFLHNNNSLGEQFEGCGGMGYMVPLTAVREGYTFYFAGAGQRFIDVCAGAYFACVHRDDGLASCWGSQTTVPNTTGASAASPMICRATAAATYDQSGNGLPIFDAETLTCGAFHVVATTVDDGPGPRNLVGLRTAELFRRGNAEALSVRQSLYNWTHRSVQTCGSNAELQLGRSVNVDLRSDQARPPILAVREEVATASFATHLRQARPDQRPLQTVSGAAALGNATVVMTRLRSFEDPASVLNSFASATGQRPPDGEYRLADTGGFGNSSWRLDFSTLPGAPLLVIGNVSSGSGWLAPQSDTLMRSTTATVTGGSGGFQRGIAGLNRTTSVRESFDNSTRLFRRSVRTTIQHFYVKGPNGYLRNLTGGNVRPCPSPAASAYCDFSQTPNVVVWAPSGVSIPSGHTNGLSQHAWLTLCVFLETVEFDRTLGVPVTQREIDVIGFDVAPTNQTILPFLPRWAAWEAYSGSVGQREAQLVCTPTMSLHDCSGASWIEGWANDHRYSADFSAFSSSALAGWPVGGAVVKVELSPASASFNILTLRAPSFTPLAMATTEQPSGLRESNIGLGNVCVFLKVGIRWYYVRFHTQSKVIVCSTGTLSRTSTPTTSHTRSIQEPPPGPSPATVPPQVEPMWEMIGPDLLRIVNLDAAGINPVPDVNNITFELSCGGGLRHPEHGVGLSVDQDLNDYDLSTFLLFTNDTLGDLFRADPAWFAADDANGTERSASRLLRARAAGALGCDIGYVTHPFTEAVSFTRLFVSFRVGRSFPTSGDRVVIEMIGSAFDTKSGVRYRFVLDWRSVEVFDVTAGRGTDGRVSVATLTCTPGPARLAEFNEVVFEFDHKTSRTSIVMNGRVACEGILLSEAQTRSLSGLYLGAWNPLKRLTTAVSFREIVACDMRTAVADIFGCRVLQKEYDADLRTATKSLAETATESLNPTESESLSLSMTSSATDSETVTQSQSESWSINPTPTDSLEPSASDTLSVSLTVSESSTGGSESMTASAIPFRWLYLDDYNEDVSSTTLLRRTGLVVKLSVAGDYFNYNEDWQGRAAGMLSANSSVTAEANAHGMLALLNVEGFVVGTVTENRSELVLQFGPYDGYHSLADEHIELSIRPAGFASYMEPPNSIHFLIPGPGAQVTVASASLELGAFASSAAGLAFGAPPSLMFGVARNAILLNYQCFGSERTRISYLLHPLQSEIGGSDGVAMVIVNSVLGVGIVAFHLLVVGCIKLTRPQLHWYQAMGYAYFPSLTVLLCTLPAVGATWGAFRAAFTGDLNVIFLLYPAAVCIAIGFTLAYLYSVLYDDSNFCAIFVALPEETLKLRRRQQPFLDMLALPGMWEPIDRQLSFHRRLWFCFWEFTHRRRYFNTIDMVALFTETLVLGVPGATLAVCTAQMAVIVLLRVALLATLLLFKPHNYRAGLPIAVVTGVVQVMTAAVYAMYVAANFTNTLRSASRGMLLLSTTVLFVVSVAALVCFARLKVLVWSYERDVAKIAELDKLPRKLQPPSEEQEGGENEAPLLHPPGPSAGVDNGPNPAQELDFTKSHRDDGSEPGELMVLGGGNPLQASVPRNDSVFRKIDAVSCISFDSVNGLTSAAANAASEGGADGGDDRQSVDAMPQDSRSTSARQPKQGPPKPPPGPEVWRLIAMEEALDRQCDDIPVFDDDLL